MYGQIIFINYFRDITYEKSNSRAMKFITKINSILLPMAVLIMSCSGGQKSSEEAAMEEGTAEEPVAEEVVDEWISLFLV